MINCVLKKVLQDRAFANDKIHFAWNTVVEEIKGEQKVTSVLLKDVKTGEVREQASVGVFIYVGLDPVSEFATELGILDENGWVVTDDHMRTTVQVFLRLAMFVKKDLRQVTTASETVRLLAKKFINISQKTFNPKNLSFLSQIFHAFLSVFNRAEMCYNGTNFMVGIHRTNQ